MDISLIYKKMEPEVAARGCFIVEVTASRDNDIVLSIESEHGTVEMDDCVALSERFQEIFDREEEDYSLTVTSAGLDQPFKILRQYVKAAGSAVTVNTRDGRKITGTLVSADEGGFTLAHEVRETVPGKKRKEMVMHEERFGFDAVNSVIPYLSI